MVEVKQRVSEKGSKILLVTAVLKQVHSDLHIDKKQLKMAYKSWKNSIAKKQDLNQVNNKRRVYEELLNAKKDAQDFINSERLEEFIDDWNLDLNPDCVKNRLLDPKPIEVM